MALGGWVIVDLFPFASKEWEEERGVEERRGERIGREGGEG